MKLLAIAAFMLLLSGQVMAYSKRECHQLRSKSLSHACQFFDRNIREVLPNYWSVYVSQAGVFRNSPNVNSAFIKKAIMELSEEQVATFGTPVEFKTEELSSLRPIDFQELFHKTPLRNQLVELLRKSNLKVYRSKGCIVYMDDLSYLFVDSTTNEALLIAGGMD